MTTDAPDTAGSPAAVPTHFAAKELPATALGSLSGVDPLRVDTVADGEHVTLLVTGELRQETVRRLATAATAALATPGPLTVVVDLTATTFMDSTGLGALVGLRNELLVRQGRLLLVRPDDKVFRLFEITNLNTVFEFTTAAEA